MRTEFGIPYCPHCGNYLETSLFKCEHCETEFTKYDYCEMQEFEVGDKVGVWKEGKKYEGTIKAVKLMVFEGEFLYEPAYTIEGFEDEYLRDGELFKIM